MSVLVSAKIPYSIWDSKGVVQDSCWCRAPRVNMHLKAESALSEGAFKHHFINTVIYEKPKTVAGMIVLG